MPIEPDDPSIETVVRHAQETRLIAEALCEVAGDAQERAQEIMRVCRLAQQRRRDAKKVIPT